jgi:hypothetical protein
MPGESIRDSGAWVDLETSGAVITNNSFVPADNANFSLSSDGGSRPHLQFEIEFTFGTAPTAGTSLALHAQDIDLFGGTDDGRSPSANNTGGFQRSVGVENVTAAQRFRFDLMFAPQDAAYWLQNVATGQSVSSGWKLRARAWSLKAA